MSKESRKSVTISSEPPEFMRDIPDEYWFNQMQEDPGYHIIRAYYAGNDMETVERDQLFQAAGDMRRAQERAEQLSKEEHSLGDKRSQRKPRVMINLAEWNFEVKNTYPEEALSVSEKTNTANPDVPPRAAYLYEALRQLLLLVDAPDAMTRDLQTLLGVGSAHVATKRAEVQAVMIAHPEWSETKIAKECAFNQTRMKKEIEARKLRDFRELRKQRSCPDKP